MSQSQNNEIVRVSMNSNALYTLTSHCCEFHPTKVYGVLLGLLQRNTLEISEVLSVPIGEDLYETNYYRDMLFFLSRTNIDGNVVGWYTNTFSYTEEDLKVQAYFYKTFGKNSLFILVDPLTIENKPINIKGMVSSEIFPELFIDDIFTIDSFNKNESKFPNLFDEKSIFIHNSPYSRIYIDDISKSLNVSKYSYLGLSYNPYIQTQINRIINSVRELNNEYQERIRYEEELIKISKERDIWLDKRRAENEIIISNGGAPLSEDNPDLSLPQEPKHIKSVLLSNEINDYQSRVKKFGELCMKKLFISKCLQ